MCVNGPNNKKVVFIAPDGAILDTSHCGKDCNIDVTKFPSIISIIENGDGIVITVNNSTAIMVILETLNNKNIGNGPGLKCL